MSVQIVEILRPAEQGRSGPYVCRGEDDHLYFVKGRNTGRRSQIAEWICAHLAIALDLPLAPFAMVEIVPELLKETSPAMQEIGAGLAFGSQEYRSALWYELEQVDKTNVKLQRDILVFDWWVHNSDRLSHNSNLLWDASQEKLVVIDHNMAFDPDFIRSEFIVFHIFGRQVEHVFDDLVEQAEYQERLQKALVAFDTACDSIPEAWWWFDDERTVKTDFDLEAARTLLTRCNSSNFWRGV
ncbi:MAG: HipA family kinase [Pseudomonadota bacterium]|nr:HipA family kinase [Pseudomonadota bacterium]